MLFNLPLDEHVLIKLIYRSTLARSCQFKRKNYFIWLSREYFVVRSSMCDQFDIGLYDELENLSTEKMSKRKSVEDVKDVNTGKITRFFF